MQGLARKITELARHPRVFLQGVRTTYSQYVEDLTIHALLHPRARGTYVDVGSHHPVAGSNTFKLYQRGWRGVTVDPNPRFVPLYRRHRPDGIHVHAGIAQTVGSIEYFEFENDVFNTFSRDRAEGLRGAGTAPTRTTTVACRSLRDVVDEHLGDRPIDLLSVDCEGLDLDVLLSLDLERRRPSAIVVESYDRYRAFRDGRGRCDLHAHLSGSRYHPVAQIAFSALYVAADFRDLNRPSGAFDVERIQGGILP
jgi:FkbM family methyltransferase